MTSTRLPLTSRRPSSVFSATWLRGSRSSIASGRICLTRTWPLTSWDRLGSVVIGTLKSSSRRTKLRTVAGVALGMATRASPALRRRDDAGEIRPGAEHLDAMNRAAELRPVVIDETDRLVDTALLHLPNDHVARITGADDQHRPAGFRSGSADGTTRQRSRAPPRKQTSRSESIITIERGYSAGPELTVDEEMQQKTAGEDRQHDTREVPDAGVSPETAVQPERKKREAPNGEQPGQRLHVDSEVRRRNRPVESQPECEIRGRRDQCEIEDRDDRQALDS